MRQCKIEQFTTALCAFDNQKWIKALIYIGVFKRWEMRQNTDCFRCVPSTWSAEMWEQHCVGVDVFVCIASLPLKGCGI